MNVEMLTLCDAATSEGGKINLLGTFDVINITDLKSPMPPFSFVSRVRFNSDEVGKHKFRIEICTEDRKKKMVELGGKIEVNIDNKETDTTAINITFGVNGAKVEELGKYLTELYIDDKKLASVPLYLKKEKKQ